MKHTLAQLVGLALCAAGAWLLSPAAGLLVAGVSLLLVGLALEIEQRRGARGGN